MYKVTYYGTDSTSEQSLLTKWFTTAEEAFAFSRSLGDRIVQTDHVADLDKYPLPDLDLL